MTRVDILYLMVGVCFIYWIAKIVYNLFLHPLRKYPGPRYLGANRLFLTYHILSGSQVQWIRALHDNYGHVVRIGPNDLSYTDEGAWQDVLGSTQSAKYGMEKDESLAKLIGDEMTNPNSAVPHAEQKHTRMRRAFAPALTKHALRLQTPMILGHVDELIHEICQRLSRPMDMVDMYGFCVYNMFTDLFLGESLDLFKSSKYHSWVYSFTGFAKGTTMMGALHHFPIMRYILKAVLLTVGKSQRDAFLSVCFERFDRRLATTTDRPDLLHFAMGDKKQLSVQELRDFAPFLIIGGGETTPTLLSGLTFLLLKHEKKLARLTQEIRSNFTDDKQMTMEKLFQMPYLSACIEEALRIYPPIAGAVERVVPRGGASVLGQHVPHGTLVTLCHHAIYHVSRNFNLANELVPERWLPEAGAEFSRDRKNALKPFSFGNQACIGQELAQFVTRLILCKLLWAYDLELRPESESWMSKQKGFFVWVKPPLILELRHAQLASVN